MKRIEITTIILLLGAGLTLIGAGCAAATPGASNGAADVDQTGSQADTNQAPTAVSPEEQAFNDSGRAKAIEDSTDLWMSYGNENVGISLRYPHNISFGAYQASSPYRLRLEAKPLEGLAGPLGYSQETAEANREALAVGEYGEAVDFPLAESKRVRAVDGTNAQEFMVLGRFEVCDVTFERKLYLFNGDYLILLTLSGDWEDLVTDSAEYFKSDLANCGQRRMWDHERQSEFYQELAAGQGGALTQEWYDLFDRLVGTIELTEAQPPTADAEAENAQAENTEAANVN